MVSPFVRILDRGPNTLGVVLERLDDGHYKVQVGHETIEVAPTNLQPVSLAETQDVRDQLKAQILQLLPEVKEILKDCPECSAKLESYIDDKSY